MATFMRGINKRGVVEVRAVPDCCVKSYLQSGWRELGADDSETLKGMTQRIRTQHGKGPQFKAGEAQPQPTGDTAGDTAGDGKPTGTLADAEREAGRTERPGTAKERAEATRKAEAGPAGRKQGKDAAPQAVATQEGNVDAEGKEPGGKE